MSPEPAVLRLIDANANRAREALRVLEDYARFVLDDGRLSADLKDVRHGLAEALRDVLPEAILFRDTPGDVGTANKTASEFAREGLQDVVVAAGKRLGEALRSLEEFSKVVSPLAASQIELLRYVNYDLELRITTSFGFTRERFQNVDLYVLITECVCNRPWLEAAEEAIRGGANCLQLREKDLDSGELLRRAKDFVSLCRDYGVVSIINDRPDIAVLADADGVHVGQGDLPVTEARKIVGTRRIVGVSTHEIAHARQAVLDGADYIGVGPFFRSPTKPRDFTAGPEYARQVAEQVDIPAVAIAGITADNVDEVLATGIKAVAVTAAVLAADDVATAAKTLKEKLTGRAFEVRERVEHRPGGQTFLSVTRNPLRASGVTAPPPEARHNRPIQPSRTPQSQRPPTDTASPGRPHPVPPEAAPPHRIGTEITRRHLPHWQIKGATYVLTFRLASGELDRGERHVVLEHLKAGHGRYYTLIAAVVMPDHVHMILTPLGEHTLSRIEKGTKGVTARLLNVRNQRSGRVWQEECWDTIIRTKDDLNDRLQYLLDNPVRKGLVADGWEWDGWYYNPGRPRT